MKLNEYLANAAILPPSAPDTPSVGYPSLGDQQTGVRATLVGDYWYYQVQQEIANLLSAAGVTAASADLTQLGQAVLALGAGNLQVADAAALRLVDLKASIQVAQTLGALTAGDSGGGVWRWDAASTAADNTGTVLLPTGHSGAGRWVRQYSGALNVRWFGALGQATDDTAAINAALAALPAGCTCYIPEGTYRIHRGNGSPIADNILADGITIMGAGKATRLVGYNAAGVVPPNSSGGPQWNLFQATGRSGLTLRDLSCSGFATLLNAQACADVVVTGVTGDGRSVGTTYLFDKGLHFHQCTNVKVSQCHFDNYFFAAYLSGTDGTRTRAVTISQCSFDQTADAGAFTATFPVGVYIYYADEVIVENCFFKNIYSSVPNGNTGTGMGYGVYEGDGACRSLSVCNNNFLFEGKGSGNAIAAFLSYTINGVVSGNVVVGAFIRTDIWTDYTTRIISSNQCAKSGIHVQLQNLNNTYHNTVVSIIGNTINDKPSSWEGSGLQVLYIQHAAVLIENNTLLNTTYGVNVTGNQNNPILYPRVINNRIERTEYSGITFSYAIGGIAIGNTIIDSWCNDTVGGEHPSILFSGYSFGSTLINNQIINKNVSTGVYKYGILNYNNASDRIFKDICSGNVFINNGAGTLYYRILHTGAWYSSIYDIEVGDFHPRWPPSPSNPAGIHCTYTKTLALTADASSASTTVTVDSTTGLAAGDAVLLMKSSDPFSNGNYYTWVFFHVDTVASVTDGTHFVLTTGIPAADGTYVAGTAFCKVARWKAGANLAA